MTLHHAENKFLNSLVLDCLTYKLSQAESLAYIKLRFHEIGITSLKRRKGLVQSDKSVQQWLNEFTRVGFVKLHKEQIENAQRIQDDSMRRLIVETSREPRNLEEIHKLKEDIRKNIYLITELSLGTPIVAAIKAKLADKEREGRDNNNNVERIQERGEGTDLR